MSLVSTVKIAELTKGLVIGPEVYISGISSISDPKPQSLSFASGRFLSQLERPDFPADCVVLTASFVESCASTQIVVQNPRLAFAKAASSFFPPPRQVTGRASTSVIHESAMIHETASIGHFCVIGPGVIVGRKTEVRHHVVLGAGSKIGSNCLIKSHAVIGEEGYGFELDESSRGVKVPHYGSVEIGDDVEIGCATVVVKATFGATRIGDRTKIDDHCFIAHNVIIGEDVKIIAGSEISGSVIIGDRAWIAPQVCILNQVQIGADALIGIGSVVTRNVDPEVIVAGNPAKELRKA